MDDQYYSDGAVKPDPDPVMLRLASERVDGEFFRVHGKPLSECRTPAMREGWLRADAELRQA